MTETELSSFLQSISFSYWISTSINGTIILPVTQLWYLRNIFNFFALYFSCTLLNTRSINGYFLQNVSQIHHYLLFPLPGLTARSLSLTTVYNNLTVLPLVGSLSSPIQPPYYQWITLLFNWLILTDWLIDWVMQHAGHEILVPPPGIQPVPPAVEAWNLSHWTVREVPGLFF